MGQRAFIPANANAFSHFAQNLGSLNIDDDLLQRLRTLIDDILGNVAE